MIKAWRHFPFGRPIGAELVDNDPIGQPPHQFRPSGSRWAERCLAMDFVHDQLATGLKIRVLTVVNTFSRYGPMLDARFSYRGEDVVATPDRMRRQIGYPATIRVDQGSEFISRDVDLWAYQRGVTLDFSRPMARRSDPVKARSVRSDQ